MRSPSQGDYRTVLIIATCINVGEGRKERGKDQGEEEKELAAVSAQADCEKDALH